MKQIALTNEVPIAEIAEGAVFAHEGLKLIKRTSDNGMIQGHSPMDPGRSVAGYHPEVLVLPYNAQSTNPVTVVLMRKPHLRLAMQITEAQAVFVAFLDCEPFASPQEAVKQAVFQAMARDSESCYVGEDDYQPLLLLEGHTVPLIWERDERTRSKP